jgi:hypothetical protein
MGNDGGSGIGYRIWVIGRSKHGGGNPAHLAIYRAADLGPTAMTLKELAYFAKKQLSSLLSSIRWVLTHRTYGGISHKVLDRIGGDGRRIICHSIWTCQKQAKR